MEIISPKVINNCICLIFFALREFICLYSEFFLIYLLLLSACLSALDELYISYVYFSSYMSISALFHSILLHSLNYSICNNAVDIYDTSNTRKI